MHLAPPAHAAKLDHAAGAILTSEPFGFYRRRMAQAKDRACDVATSPGHPAATHCCDYPPSAAIRSCSWHPSAATHSCSCCPPAATRSCSRPRPQPPAAAASPSPPAAANSRQPHHQHFRDSCITLQTIADTRATMYGPTITLIFVRPRARHG